MFIIKYVLRNYLPWAVIALLLFSTIPSFLSFNNYLGQIRGGLAPEGLNKEQLILLAQSSLPQPAGDISENLALFDIEIGPATLPIRRVEQSGVGKIIYLTVLFLIASVMVPLVVGLTLTPKKRAEFERENL